MNALRSSSSIIRPLLGWATIGPLVQPVNRNRFGFHLVVTAVVVAFVGCGIRAAAQINTALTESRVRALARQARTESRGDPTELVLALDRRVRESWGEFDSFPLSILRRDDLLVTLTGPYVAYRRSVVDMLRTKRPIDEASWVDAAVLVITPNRLTAPDITAVELTRNGVAVAPTTNRLRPMTFDNGAGERGVLNAGDVRFPASAFRPGATVVLTLRPRAGEPFVYRFTEAELSGLK